MARYLVYTCVTRNYDKIRKIASRQDPNIDFVCFTDKTNKTLDLRQDTGWVFMPMPVELRELDSRRQARMIKIGIYKYMRGYSGYLWIDAPIIIIGNIGDFIREHPFNWYNNLYVSKHYMRDCVYQEFAQVIRLNKDRSAKLYDQHQRYQKMGYPEHNGMAETSLLYRNFNDLKVQNHAVIWAEEVMNYSYRDQLSFNWAAWTTKLPITYLNEDIYKKDVENETSKYFFMPWPKHNNPNVVAQLQARLNKNKLSGLVVDEKNLEITKDTKAETIVPSVNSTNPPTSTKTLVDKFEQEYQCFIEDLKKQKRISEEAKKQSEEKAEPSPTPQPTPEPQEKPVVLEEKPKRKRGRPRKIKN